jgi:hypothetical protein
MSPWNSDSPNDSADHSSESTLRLPGLRAWVCSGLTLSGASLFLLKGGGWRRRTGQKDAKKN